MVRAGDSRAEDSRGITTAGQAQDSTRAVRSPKRATISPCHAVTATRAPASPMRAIAAGCGWPKALWRPAEMATTEGRTAERNGAPEDEPLPWCAATRSGKRGLRSRKRPSADELMSPGTMASRSSPRRSVTTRLASLRDRPARASLSRGGHSKARPASGRGPMRLPAAASMKRARTAAVALATAAHPASSRPPSGGTTTRPGRRLRIT